jgi:hypothetical protein
LEIFAESCRNEQPTGVFAIGVRQLDIPVEDGCGAPSPITAQIVQ